MLSIKPFCFLLFILQTVICHAQLSPFIHIDQFGYQVTAEKVAVLSDPQTGYNSNLSYTPGESIQLVDAVTESVVFSAAPILWNNGATHSQSGDRGWWFDFSSVQTTGTYYILDPSNSEQSPNFEINNNPYSEVLKAATKMFYYNRCNMDKVAPYAGANWVDATNFLNPLQDANCRFYLEPNNVAKEKELSGGWFDAGDYNKYINYLPSTIDLMLSAYEDNPMIFTDDWNIPESGNGIPDILDEIKYELDWMYKMSNSDGSVHIKQGSISFNQNANSPPSTNTDPRYYGNTCTSSSISTAHIFAHAAKVYNAIGETAYAIQLEDRAAACFYYFKQAVDTNSIEIECDDSTINASDSDMDAVEQMDLAISASVYLFELTGQTIYDNFFMQYYASSSPIANYYWEPYKLPLSEALLLYSTLPNANSTAKSLIIDRALNALTNNGSGFFELTNTDLYRVDVPDWMYHWGSNNPIVNVGNLCLLLKKYNIDSAKNVTLQRRADELVHYIHGLNPLGLVFLTNMYSYGGDRCVDEMYHGWFADGTVYDNAQTSQSGPAPGFLVGGANPSYAPDPQNGVPMSPPMNQPQQKSYLDFNTGYPQNSWQISEPAIYYQAAYLRLLSSQVNTSLTNTNADIEVSADCMTLYPNPTAGIFEITGVLANYDITILDSLGNVHTTYQATGSKLSIDINALPNGLFYIKMENLNNSNICIQKIIKE